MPPDVPDVVPAAIGLAAGLLVGVSSIGGGALLTSALILIARVPPTLAIGSGVLIAGGMKLVGGGYYAFRRDVHWGTVGRLAVGSIPGALIGMAILDRMPVERIESWLTHLLGFVIAAAGMALLLQATRSGRPRPCRTPPHAATSGLGLLTGVLVSMTSVGSGSLLLSALALVYPLRAREAVGTDLVHALVLSVVAALGHASAGRVDLTLAAAVLAGAVPGVLVGARLATWVPESALRGTLAVVLLAIGLPLAAFGV